MIYQQQSVFSYFMKNVNISAVKKSVNISVPQHHVIVPACVNPGSLSKPVNMTGGELKSNYNRKKKHQHWCAPDSFTKQTY